MYFIIWEYTVDPQNRERFEVEYQRGGRWFKFFETNEDYLGSDFIQDTTSMDRYVIIDKWISKDSYEEFLSENEVEYHRINEELKTLYQNENRLGSFFTLQ